jgi:hemerythrin superfamily protein
LLLNLISSSNDRSDHRRSQRPAIDTRVFETQADVVVDAPVDDARGIGSASHAGSYPHSKEITEMAGSKGTSGRGTKASAKGRGRRATSARGTGRRGRIDAISLLKSDHREVEGLFKQFEKARSGDRKGAIAQKICTALKAHTKIEEEIFYPVFLEATEEKDLHHEAEVEHEGAKRLIGEIESMSADDDYYEAKVTVLSEMIKHHVKEEEQPGGMFAKARQSEMDLEALGQQLKQRKSEVLSELEAQADEGESSREDETPAELLRRNNRGGQPEVRRG